MREKPTQEERARVLGAIGSIKTPKKAASSARNIALSSANKPKPLNEIPCTCGRCPDVYASDVQAGAASCRRAGTIRTRQFRERQRLADG